MKLNPDELDVMSFDTGPADTEVAPITTHPNDPTPATFCRICPVGTSDCY
ncbi:MAG TPA: hypothetical protein VF006_07180 [Longimicrobium sp.]